MVGVRRLWLVAAASCSVQLGVPPEAQIECTSDAQCPDGRFCDLGISRCVAVGASVAEVTSRPVLGLPGEGGFSQTAVKPGDVIAVGGEGEPGAQVVAARLIDARDETVQELTAGQVTVDEAGALGGLFIAGELDNGSMVRLEVVLAARGRQSAPEDSRSQAVAVDTEAPADVTVVVMVGDVPTSIVAAPAIDVRVNTSDAVHMRLGGNVDPLASATPVGEWLAFDATFATTLTADDGSKSVVVTVRDGAFNETLASTAVELDADIPIARPVITGPNAALRRVQSGSILTVSGYASAARESARLLGLDDAGAELGGCATDVSSAVTVVGTSLLGTLPLAGLCAGARRVALEVVVGNGVRSSVPELSRSAVLVIDDAGPSPGTATIEPIANALDGFTPTARIVLRLTATEPSGCPVEVPPLCDGIVEVRLSGDLVDDERTFEWIRLTDVPTLEPVTLAGPDDDKTIEIEFRDTLGNTRFAPDLQIYLDTSPPLPPARSLVRIAELAPAPDVPPAGEAANRVWLSGEPSAAANSVAVDVFASTGALDAAARLTTAPVDAEFAIALTELQRRGDDTYRLVAVDAAGNRGAPLTVTLPQLSWEAVAVTPDPARAGAQFGNTALRIAFASAVPLRGLPLVIVAGQTAPCTGTTSAPGPYSCTIADVADVAANEGDAVVRVVAEAAAADGAAGSYSTFARIMTLDFTEPEVVGASLQVVPGDTGFTDHVEGLPGAASDNLSAPEEMWVEVLTPAGVLLDEGPVDALGGFAALDIGDNAHPLVRVRISDLAKNAAALRDVVNDITQPAITNITVTPADATTTDTVTVRFRVSDASDLRALPAVTIGGRTVTPPAAGTGTSLGPIDYEYAYVPQGGTDTDGQKEVRITATDRSGNARTASVPSAVRFDLTPPSVLCTLPRAAARWNGVPATLGTATDAGVGVDLVQGALRRVADGTWLNLASGAFESAVQPLWEDADFVAPNWRVFERAGIPFAAGGYELHVRAYDVLGNVSATLVRAFTYDESFTEPPVNLRAFAFGEARVRVTWEAPSSPSQRYFVFYGPEGESDYLGTGAAEGPSPIEVGPSNLRFDLTGLPRGRYRVTAVAEDQSGLQSAYAPERIAASRWWTQVSPDPLPRNPSKPFHLGAGVFLDLGYAGHIRRSTDGGQSWSAIAPPADDNALDMCRLADGTVIVRTNGLPWRSTDGGATFTQSNAPNLGETYTMACAGSTAVITNRGQVITSTDGGLNYTQTHVEPATNLFGATVFNGRFIVVGGTMYTSQGVIVTSADGLTWSSTLRGNRAYVHAVAGAGSAIVLDAVATGQHLVLTSTDGVTWNDGPTLDLNGGYGYGATFGAGAFWVAGFNKVATLPEGGTSWTITDAPFTAIYWIHADATGVVFGGGYQVGTMPAGSSTITPTTVRDYGSGAVDGNTVVYSAAGALQRSTNRAASFSTVIDKVAIHGLTRHQNLLVAMRDADFQVSADGGETWQGSSGCRPVGGTPATLRSNDTVIIASAEYSGSSIRVCRSTDGVAWSQINAGNVVNGGYASSVTYHGGTTWFITGGNRIFRSQDNGLNWTIVHNDGAYPVQRVHSDGTNVLAIGSTNTFAPIIVGSNSADGGSFVQQSPPSGMSSSAEAIMNVGSRWYALFTNDFLQMGGSWAGGAWSRVPNTYYSHALWTDGTNAVVFGTQGIYTTNGGTSWQSSNRAALFGEQMHLAAGWREPVSGDTVLYGAAKRMYSSIDRGQNWVQSRFVAHRPIDTIDRPFSALEVLPATGVAYATGAHGMLFELGPE